MRAVDLTLGFGPKTVLEQVSLDFPARSVTTLLGPTGSGKTTFLRTLNRMNDRVTGYRRRGDVLLGARSIFESRDLMELRRRVGMLFQRPNPFPMSILDNVVAGTRAHKMVPRKGLAAVAEARLTEVGLWDAVKDRLDDSPFRLSGGQQQLLCLARALAVNPEVLLLDEPTASLDPATTEKIAPSGFQHLVQPQAWLCATSPLMPTLTGFSLHLQTSVPPAKLPDPFFTPLSTEGWI